VGQFHSRQMPEQGPVRIEYAFWISGGAGGVDDNRRIIGSGRNPRVIRRGRVDEFSPFKHAVLVTLIDADQNWRRGKPVRYADQLFNSRCVRDDDFGTAVIETVLDSFWTEKREQGQRDRAQPISGKMGNQGFRALR
jgi:hypothetical protein